MSSFAFDTAAFSDDPFPHVVLDDALSADVFDATRRAIPPPERFALKGRGLKLELDISESSPQLKALPADDQARLIDIREMVRAAAPVLAARFSAALRRKYCWLLGDALADEVISAGWTTTHGRLMGRAPGYRLDPHLDSSHAGITCLLYFTDAATPDEGALSLYRPEREPAVLTPSTYYPGRAEGISTRPAKAIEVKPNRFVAFVNTPVSLHGYHRGAGASGWRIAYQAHVLPAGLRMDDLVPRLDSARRQRWQVSAG